MRPRPRFRLTLSRLLAIASPTYQAAFPLALLLLRLTRKNIYSFLVFSKEAEKYRQEMLTKELRSIWILVGSFILSVLAEIIGNYGYIWMVK